MLTWHKYFCICVLFVCVFLGKDGRMDTRRVCGALCRQLLAKGRDGKVGSGGRGHLSIPTLPLALIQPNIFYHPTHLYILGWGP